MSVYPPTQYSPTFAADSASVSATASASATVTDSAFVDVDVAAAADPTATSLVAELESIGRTLAHCEVDSAAGLLACPEARHFAAGRP